MSNRLTEKQVIYDGSKLRLELHHLVNEESGHKHKREVVVPWTNKIPIALYRIAPGLVEFGMMKMMR